MNSVQSPPEPNIRYPSRSVERAKRSLRCSPFKLPLFTAMRDRSIPLAQIAGTSGTEQQYTQRQLSELAADNALLWLIQVGVLRREVDGQGITDSYRLTPLGRQIVEQWQQQGNQIPQATLGDRIYNTLNRWLAILGFSF